MWRRASFGVTAGVFVFIMAIAIWLLVPWPAKQRDANLVDQHARVDNSVCADFQRADPGLGPDLTGTQIVWFRANDRQSAGHESRAEG